MKIVLVAHDIRSCHNVGSLLRTADGVGVDQVYLTGYTPYPEIPGDTRLPHIRNKLSKQIHKTALGAELSVPWSQSDEILPVIDELRSQGYAIVALEQSESSVDLSDYRRDHDIALLIGREVEGIDPRLLSICDEVVEIPMLGNKESFNVVQATAICLYHLRHLVKAS